MTAVLVPTANEAEWLEARRKGVTASEIAVLMGLSPYSSPYALYHQKLGILPADDDNPVMERGRVLEPYIAERFAKAHPEFAALGDGRTLWRHWDRPWQLATPDQMVHPLVEVDRCTCGAGPGSYAGMHEPGCGWELDAPVAVAEYKSTSNLEDWGEPGTDEIPVHYRCQVLWQMDVTGVGKAYITVLDIPRWEIREYVIEHNPAGHVGDSTGEQPQGDCDVCDDLLMMRGEARLFLGRIDRQDPPDVDWRPATLSALRSLHSEAGETDVMIGRQLAISYRAAVRRYKAAERRKDHMTARVLQAIGDGRRAIEANTDLPVATRSVSHPRKVSTTLLRELYPAIADECTPDPKPVVKLDPAKPKKEKTS